MPRASKWDKPGIKAAVERKGETLRSLSLANDFHRDDCSVALRRRYPKAEQVISEFLGVPLNELWPDRYDDDGLPIRYVRADQRAVTPAQANRLRQINRESAMPRMARGAA